MQAAIGKFLFCNTLKLLQLQVCSWVGIYLQQELFCYFLLQERTSVYLSRLSIVTKPQIYLLYLITYYANQQDGTLVYSFSLWLSWYLSLYDKSVATVSMSRIALCRIVQTCVWLAQLFKLKINFSFQQSNYDTLASSTVACTLL